jgi:hypothetical protein
MNWSRFEKQPSDAAFPLEQLLIEGLISGKEIQLSPGFWTELK